jgi:ubiquinol-cytochrome c reductase cytochrome b subunit
LGKPPDPSIIEATPRPDWYFMWYFAVLALLPHGIEQYLMVYGPLLAGIILIALPFLFNRGERSLRRRPGPSPSVLMIVVMIATLWVEGREIPVVAQFQGPTVVGVRGGRDQWSGLYRRAIVS